MIDETILTELAYEALNQYEDANNFLLEEDVVKYFIMGFTKGYLRAIEA